MALAGQPKTKTDPSEVIFDPSLIPPEAADRLAAETLRLVRWMMMIPKYREAIEEMNMARRTARAQEGG